MKLVIVDVKLTEEDPEPEAKLDEGEHIVKRVVEVKDLWKTLEGELGRPADLDFGTLTIASRVGMADYSEKGYILDARLSHIAMGLHLSKELSLN